MALTQLKTSGIADDAVTTDKLANAINTERTANTAKVSTTINNNADNRVITGSGTANTLEGESNLTFTGSILTVTNGSGAAELTLVTPNNTDGGVYFNDGTNSGAVTYQHSDDSMRFRVNATEKMRVESTGNLQIKRDKYIGTVASGQSAINIGSSGGAQIGFHQVSTNDDELRFYTHTSGSSHAERMRIDSSGNVMVGCTSTDSNSSTGIRLLGHGAVHSTRSNEYAYIGRRSDSDGGLFLFRRGSGNVGSISVFESSTSFNTSSDYRLKENVTAISDGITRLKTLKPSRFNFKSNKDLTVDGFLAHEVTAVPEAVTGTKDAVATEDSEEAKKGDPIYQQIDQSKLVPLLTAALQEAIAKIETLETKVAALEAA